VKSSTFCNIQFNQSQWLSGELRHETECQQCILCNSAEHHRRSISQTLITANRHTVQTNHENKLPAL